jgi:hypothetical protein
MNTAISNIATPSAHRSMKGHRPMSYTVTINEPKHPDAMPMWESFDHATAEDAYRAAQTHIETAQPDDRIVDQGDGVYDVWTTAGEQPASHVATIVIAPSDDLYAEPVQETQEADNA